MNSYDLPAPQRYLPQPSKLEASAEDSDPAKLMSANKRELLHSRIDMLQGQIDKRCKVHEDVLIGIEQDDLFCGTAALQCECREDYSGALDIRLKQVFALRKEKRGELTSYIRDTATLRDKLMEALLQYKATDQQEDLLSKLN